MEFIFDEAEHGYYTENKIGEINVKVLFKKKETIFGYFEWEAMLYIRREESVEYTTANTAQVLFHARDVLKSFESFLTSHWLYKGEIHYILVRSTDKRIHKIYCDALIPLGYWLDTYEGIDNTLIKKLSPELKK